MESAPCRLANQKGSGFKREWRDACIGNHSDWTYMFWDRESALIFLETHYPWFLGTFKSYPKTVLQGKSPTVALSLYVGRQANLPCMSLITLLETSSCHAAICSLTELASCRSSCTVPPTLQQKVWHHVPCMALLQSSALGQAHSWGPIYCFHVQAMHCGRS